jgi:hypothetical protein
MNTRETRTMRRTLHKEKDDILKYLVRFSPVIFIHHGDLIL